MNMRISSARLSVAALVASGWFGANAQSIPGAVPPSSIPTFSTANIGRQGHFYVGGHYVGEPGKETMDGAMYVEVWVPNRIRHPYPVVFITGGGGQWAYSLLQTPDGRPGWAYDFVNQGYTVYMMDYPGQGRSANIPGVDGTLLPPRSGPFNGGGLVGWPPGRDSAEQLAAGQEVYAMAKRRPEQRQDGRPCV